MSYDVHIEVRHHPKHDVDETIERTGFKMADPDGDPLIVVAGCLRQFADELEGKAAIEAVQRKLEADRDEARGRWLENHGKSR